MRVISSFSHRYECGNFENELRLWVRTCLCVVWLVASVRAKITLKWVAHLLHTCECEMHRRCVSFADFRLDRCVVILRMSCDCGFAGV